MKHPILFGAVALTGAVLSACSSATNTAAAPAPVAAPAAASPSSVVGKTIIFDSTSATYMISEDESEVWKNSTDNLKQWSMKLTSTRVTPNMELGMGTYVLICENGRERWDSTYDYRKTGATTAQLEDQGYEEVTTYKLNFTTPNSGTATSYGYTHDLQWKHAGLKFILK